MTWTIWVLFLDVLTFLGLSANFGVIKREVTMMKKMLTVVAGAALGLAVLTGCNEEAKQPVNPMAEKCAEGINVSPQSCVGLPFGVKVPKGKTIDRCGTVADQVQPGTVYYTDGATGYSKDCEDNFEHQGG